MIIGSDPPAAGIYRLHQRLGGLYGHLAQARAESAEPQIITKVVQLGDLSHLGMDPERTTLAKDRKISMSGAGTGSTGEEALFLALAEGLERYCTCIWDSHQFVWASAE